MLNRKRNRKSVPKYLKQNNPPSRKTAAPANRTPAGKVTSADLDRVQKNITRQAMLAGLTVVLTVVILFAMTSAWYTNIVQTSGLTFEAESWGFDGTINVANEDIIVSPGDKGLVNLEVENTSDSISAISINVSKDEMGDEMKKRLYLYVDTHMNRDGETMDRVYLNSREGYTYTVFSQGNLTLTEKASNAPQLKWQWVYDVLGYYVIAEPIKNEDGTIERMIVREYLRPIEYDYDEATTILEEDADGKLNLKITTVDGTYSPGAYLEIISQKDGYEGQIHRDVKTPDGYYPVNYKDAKMEYGVYAYLCNYAEIQQATKYDTDLGMLAYKKKTDPASITSEENEMLRHKAVLLISAQKNENVAINVPTLAALKNTIAQSKADVIQLSANIEIPQGESLIIPENRRVMLDLNGYTITSHSDKAIEGKPGSSLTIINGAVTGTRANEKTYGICTRGAEVVMSDVTVTNFRYGLYMGDHEENNSLDSRVHMVGCEIEAEWYAVFINGNGLLSEQKTQLIIENSTLKGGNIVLTGSGNGDRAGTDIQIIDNSYIIGTDPDGNGANASGIYQPQKNSTMTIVDSTVSGYNGIAIKGGSVSIVDSTIESDGVAQTPQENGSGFTDTGDAIYIDANYGYDIQLEISGNSRVHHKSTNSYSLQIFKPDATNVDVNLYGGTFDEKQPDAFLAEGYEQREVVENNETKFVVQKTSS